MSVPSSPPAQEDQDADEVAPWGRRETRAERTDRNFQDLVQELRVAQTGVQVLFAFLLTVPFTVRFTELGSVDRALYFTALLSSGAAAVLLIAPTAQHRILFRRGEKEQLLEWGGRCAVLGIALIGVAMVAAVLVVTDLLYGTPETWIAGAAMALVPLLLWFVIPLRRRAQVGDRCDQCLQDDCEGDCA